MTIKEFLASLIETVLNTQIRPIFGYAVLGGITGLLLRKLPSEIKYVVWIAILLTAIATYYEKIEMTKPASGF